MLRKGILSLPLVLALMGLGVQPAMAHPLDDYGDEDGYSGEMMAGRLTQGVRPKLLTLLRASCTDMGEPSFIEGRLAFLRTELAITDTQKGAWNAFADALKRHWGNVKATLQTAKTVIVEAKTPMERLNTHITSMDSRLKSLKEFKPALDTLYEALTPEQRDRANELIASLSCVR